MTLESNPVIGYSELSEITGMSVRALRSTKCRNRLPVAEAGLIGNTILFDRPQALAYAAALSSKRQARAAK